MLIFSLTTSFLNSEVNILSLFGIKIQNKKALKTVFLRVPKLLKIIETATFLRYFNNPVSRISRLSRLLPFLLAFMLPATLTAQRRNSVQTVVIDAGHGGHDPGASGLQAKEKNINLAIALKLGNLIRHNMKDVHVIYTRDKDYFVELYRRAEIANKNKADLFICIHCNANNNHTVRGAETYVMGLHKSQANLNIAKLENASILLESDYQSTYNGFDPNADESYIIFSLYQNSNLDQSSDLAAAIQTQLEGPHGGSVHGVRQAGFIVLYKTTMPSVLVETGYLSNPGEEEYLMSEKGQEHISWAIFKALKTYRENIAKHGKTNTKRVDSDTARSSSDSGNNDTTPVVKNPVKRVEKQPQPIPGTGLVYKVQIAASAVQLENGDPRLARFSKVSMYKHQGMFKYTIGEEQSLQAAETVLHEAAAKGVTDAFIVIFRNGTRIPPDEARRLLDN